MPGLRTPVTKKCSTTAQVKYTPSSPMSAAASVFQVREGTDRQEQPQDCKSCTVMLWTGIHSVSSSPSSFFLLLFFFLLCVTYSCCHDPDIVRKAKGEKKGQTERLQFTEEIKGFLSSFSRSSNCISLFYPFFLSFFNFFMFPLIPFTALTLPPSPPSPPFSLSL